jgi:hypothetical protein
MTIVFTYDPVRKQAVSSDSGIFVERINVTRERIYGFCLNWHGKRIVISAEANLTGDLPSTKHDWTITGIGRINVRVPSFHFSSNAEINAAAELALKAMLAMPITLLPTDKPIITADFSNDLKARLQSFPHYEPSARHTGAVAYVARGSVDE